MKCKPKSPGKGHSRILNAAAAWRAGLRFQFLDFNADVAPVRDELRGTFARAKAVSRARIDNIQNAQDQNRLNVDENVKQAGPTARPTPVPNGPRIAADEYKFSPPRMRTECSTPPGRPSVKEESGEENELPRLESTNVDDLPLVDKRGDHDTFGANGNRLHLSALELGTMGFKLRLVLAMVCA